MQGAALLRAIHCSGIDPVWYPCAAADRPTDRVRGYLIWQSEGRRSRWKENNTKMPTYKIEESFSEEASEWSIRTRCNQENNHGTLWISTLVVVVTHT